MVRIGQIFRSMLDSGKVDIGKRFEIQRAAVSGTMSDFHMARDRQTDKIVGLKILDKKKTEQFEARFKGLDRPCEGKISMEMIHPRIVTTYSYGLTTKGEQFIVMEFLDGPGLNSCIIGRAEILNGNRLALMTQAAEALDFVHKAGFIHRDVCPRNFVCSKAGDSLKLIDFGLTVPALPQFQQPGNRTGTPNYMAPEVVRRRSTDQRLDIFAYGVSMFELFAFDLPWQRGADGLAAMAHGASEPPPVSKFYPGIEPALEAIIMKCIQAEPDNRFSSMEQLLKPLKRIKSEDAA